MNGDGLGLPWHHPGPVWALVQSGITVEALRARAHQHGRDDLVVLMAQRKNPPDRAARGHTVPVHDLWRENPEAFLDLCFRGRMAQESHPPTPAQPWIHRTVWLHPGALDVVHGQRPASLLDWAESLNWEAVFGDPLDRERLNAHPEGWAHRYLLQLPQGSDLLNGRTASDIPREQHGYHQGSLTEPWKVLHGSQFDGPDRTLRRTVMPWAQALRENRMVVTLCPPDTGLADVIEVRNHRLMSHLVWQHAAWSMAHDPEVQALTQGVDANGDTHLRLVSVGEDVPHGSWDAVQRAWDQRVLRTLANWAAPAAEPHARPRL